MAGHTLIAVDLDDVLCQTNQCIADWHNANHGTNLELKDFHYYHYWRNPGWGNPFETFEKVQKFFDEGHLANAEPVPGAKEALEKLRGMGYHFAIVTARTEEQRETSRKWLDEHFHGLFHNLYFTGSFEHYFSEGDVTEGAGLAATPPKPYKKPITKAEVITTIGATLLIDDSLENALSCSHHTPPVPVLLLGHFHSNETYPVPHYPWNVAESTQDGEWDFLSYDEMKAKGLETGENRRLYDDLPGSVRRVRGWEGVVQALEERLREEGREVRN